MARILGVHYFYVTAVTSVLGNIPLLGRLLIPFITLAIEMVLFAGPVFMGWRMAHAATGWLLNVLYDMPNHITAQTFLGQLINNIPSRSSVTIVRETFAEDRRNKFLLKVGGPGYILVQNTDAVVTERNGRFLRVLGVGRHALEPFEYVHSVVDLRQQERPCLSEDGEEKIRLVTRDGITIWAKASIIYRICTDDENCPADGPLTQLPTDKPRTLPTRQIPYPFGPNAVRRAAYAQVVCREGNREKIETWDNLAQTITVEELRKAAASHALEDLIYPPDRDSEPYIVLQAQMGRNARRRMRQFGVYIINARIESLDFPPSVKEQCLRTWQAPRETQRRLVLATMVSQANDELAQATIAEKQAVLKGILAGLQHTPIMQSTSRRAKDEAVRHLKNLLPPSERGDEDDHREQFFDFDNSMPF